MKLLMFTETVTEMPFPTTLIVILSFVCLLIIFLFPKDKGATGFAKGFFVAVLLLATLAAIVLVVLQWYGVIDFWWVLWLIHLI